MNDISKTLTDMTVFERSSLIETVADALEATADAAGDEGDARFVANSLFVANTIRGLSGDLAPGDIKAAEVLLEQGIMLVQQFSNRGRQRAVLN
ncbi:MULTISPECIES: hypothetical protein [Rhizobium]|uniref:Uncharacterized protein n=1 Tax=Rhizobium favelukesii TaxID=348824 RepID=W6S399_9HYPH|nr:MULTISPECIES: hypothetical protein [Rhizobium]MCA0807000.1 hypothetical protein [Rhizobium sp. T1473]MCS0461548.1 hypothetical protein [Rhizobium favelukesii]UFS85550.1 hypothetical protein LPB79_35040 [Rhizobium sp. T136]CDM60851.1 hypothetical protein LPU83_pLPU83c_0289 [Rhizobium favelukesii]